MSDIIYASKTRGPKPKALDWRCSFCGDSKHYGKNLCSACYQREYRKGYAERDRGVRGAGYLRKDGYKVQQVNGETVLEHRLVAAAMLGRALLPEEIVHHIDGNRQNNDPTNLQVFANTSEHIKHHAQERRGL